MGNSFMIESQAVLELGGGNGDTVFRQNAARGQLHFIHILPQ